MKLDQWLGLGIFLLGSGVGALLTRIALVGFTRRKPAGPHPAQRANDSPLNRSRCP